MESTTLKVRGMTCSGCVASVTRVLEQINGVTRVEVALDPGQATVHYDPAVTDPARFKAAVEDAGFEAS